MKQQTSNFSVLSGSEFSTVGRIPFLNQKGFGLKSLCFQYDPDPQGLIDQAEYNLDLISVDWKDPKSEN